MTLVRKCGTPLCFEPCVPGQRKCLAHLARDAEREAIRTERRKIDQPWRALYDTPEWKRAARTRRRTDDYKCQECGIAHGRNLILSVHHRTPVWVLWERAAGDWAYFLEQATNQAILVTLCGPCHKKAERELATVHKPNPVKRYARSRPVPSKRGKGRR